MQPQHVDPTIDPAAAVPSEAAGPGSDYPAIGDYGVVGDCRTAALISRDGSVEWLCFPHFAGPSMFAAILDRERGGHFTVRPRGGYRSRRRYVGDSNVLETTFETDSGTVQVTDLLTLPGFEGSAALQPQRELLRRVHCLGGEVELEVVYDPRPGYGEVTPSMERRGRLGWSCAEGNALLLLHADIPLERRGTVPGLAGRVRLREGERRDLSLTYVRHDPAVIAPLGDAAAHRAAATLDWWRHWSRDCRYDGPHRGAVMRSALVLKLLTYSLSGALVAAPTMSLPEWPGGVRNWDYRYCWLRDAGLTVRALQDLGFGTEARGFLDWMLHATRLTWPELHVMYDIHGEAELPEAELDHLEGWRGSRPVRRGNAAHDQRQLDVYGEVVLAAWAQVHNGARLDASEARMLAGLGRTVCKQWRHTDHGIWEERNAGRHHLHSKHMCWAALDRLIKLSEEGHLRVPEERFRRERKALREFIEAKLFSAEHGTYVTAAGVDEVDSSQLLLARYGYVDARDPRMAKTYERVVSRLGRNGLLYRFPEGYDDFLPPGEGAFGIASFWVVDYLANAGRIDEAEERFAGLVGRANDLGLMAEEFDPDTGEQLGNFPQAFTHVGLISAAMSLQRARERPTATETEPW